MKSIVKIGKNSTFDKLTKKKKVAIIRLFEGVTLKTISQEIKCHINTIENWKNNEEFQQARIDYSIYALNHLLPDAVSSLSRLINDSKTPAMVKLQAIQTVLKHANLLSDNSTPELDKAKIRKANADARKTLAEAQLREAQLKAIEESDDPSNKTIIVDDIREVSDDSNSETEPRD